MDTNHRTNILIPPDKEAFLVRRGFLLGYFFVGPLARFLRFIARPYC